MCIFDASKMPSHERTSWLVAMRSTSPVTNAKSLSLTLSSMNCLCSCRRVRASMQTVSIVSLTWSKLTCRGRRVSSLMRSLSAEARSFDPRPLGRRDISIRSGRTPWRSASAQLARGKRTLQWRLPWRPYSRARYAGSSFRGPLLKQESVLDSSLGISQRRSIPTSDLSTTPCTRCSGLSRREG